MARLGGDEFAVVLPGLKQPAEAEIVAEKLIAAMRDPFEVGGISIQATVSIGIAIFRADEADPLLVLKKADEAPYRVKDAAETVSLFENPF